MCVCVFCVLCVCVCVSFKVYLHDCTQETLYVYILSNNACFDLLCFDVQMLSPGAL